jgi:hypothetical protein
MSLPPAVTVHGLDGARAAVAAAGPRGVLLLSARGAGGFAGAGWFLAIVAAAGPGMPAAIDCADAPGAALEALRAGARIVVLDRACPAFPAVAAAAAEAGACLLPDRPPSLDLARIDLRRRADRARLSAWLAMEAPPGAATPPPA